jgi:hypothetical protein
LVKIYYGWCNIQRKLFNSVVVIIVVVIFTVAADVAAVVVLRASHMEAYLSPYKFVIRLIMTNYVYVRCSSDVSADNGIYMFSCRYV